MSLSKKSIEISKEEFDKLTEERERFKLVLEGTRLGMWDWNPMTNDVVFDEYWCEMLGYELGEIKNELTEWSSRVHPDDIAQCFSDIQKHIDGEVDFYENVHRMKHKDGTWRYILDRGKIMKRDYEGNVIRFTGTHTDITKEREATLRAVGLNQILSETIVSLEEKNKDLEQMAYMISHDLKAPTIVVNSLIEIIKENHENELTKDVDDYFTEITNRVSKMSKLIDDILSYSMAGSLETNEEELDMQNVINEVLQSLEVPAGFNILLKSDNIKFRANKTPFMQVLSNLVGNAIKYHDKSQGNIDLYAKSTGDKLEVKVIDNGPGIPKKYHEKIFEMFGTANQFTRIDSSGIGLAIVKKIVTNNEGVVGVKSEINRGSEFTFTFKINSVAKKTKTPQNWF